MLEIKETFCFEKYNDIISNADVSDFHITEAVNNSSVLGFIAYGYTEKNVVIFGLDDMGDLNICDGLVRSVLFKGCLKGLDSAEFRIDDKQKLSRLASLKFVENNNKTLNNINSFMDSCKKCKEIRQTLEKS